MAMRGGRLDTTIMSGHRIIINVAVAVGLLMEAAGTAMVYVGWVRPGRLIARSSTWVGVPCTVIATRSGEEGGFRHVFKYTVRGRTYRSARSTFWGEWADFHYAV